MKEVVRENKSNDLEDSATTYILSLINVRIKVEASPSASVSGTTAQLPPPPPPPPFPVANSLLKQIVKKSK